VSSQQPDGRFVALVLRDLGAESVSFHAGHASLSPSATILSVRLGDGRNVVVEFKEPPEDREALTRRLEMLAQSFADAFSNEKPLSNPPPARSLQEELRAVQNRAMAKDALVIDAHSPVVWGSASELATIARRELEAPPANVSSPFLVRGSTSSHDWSDESGPITESDELDISARAIEALRRVVATFNLKQGKPFQHASQGPTHYAAFGFSSIYIAVLVFDEAFDELRASRTIAESIGRIEKLVHALPPLDPDPTNGSNVVALRKRRR
jgi:hypothetical protein